MCVTLQLQRSIHMCTYISIWQPGQWSVQGTTYELVDSEFEPRFRGEVFRTRSDRPRGPFNLLYNGYQVSFAVAKRRGVMLTIKVKGRVALCLSLALVSSWHITKGTLPLLLSYIYYLPPPPPNKNVSSCSKTKKLPKEFCTFSKNLLRLISGP